MKVLPSKWRSLPAASGALLALAPVLSAQHVDQAPPPPLSQAYPGPLKDAVFGKVIAGEFNGDLSLDAVVMDGTEPVLMISPEVFESAVRTDLSVNDIATLSGVLPGKDLLVTVSDSGLQLHERDSALATWKTPIVLHDGQSAWGDAIAVAVGDLDGDGDQDIAGIASDGQTILTELQVSGGTFATGATFTSAPVAYDILLCNWVEQPAASGSLEIALLAYGALEVYDSSGGQLASAPAPGPMLATVIADSPNPVDLQRLATVTQAYGRDWLTVGGSLGSEGPFDLGPSTVVSIAAGNVDYDLGPELFFGTDSLTSVVMLDYSQFNNPTFDHQAPVLLPIGPGTQDPSLNGAGLALADFDQDGNSDLIAPVQGDLTVPRETHGTVDLVDVAAMHNVAWADLRAPIASVEGYFFDPRELHVTFEASPDAFSSGVHDVQLQVTVWRTPSFGEPTAPLPYRTAQLLDVPEPGSRPCSSCLSRAVTRSPCRKTCSRSSLARSSWTRRATSWPPVRRRSVCSAPPRVGTCSARLPT